MDCYSALCEWLDKELERQENVLAVLEAQNAALRARDFIAMDGQTNALATLASRNQEAIQERARLTEDIVAKRGLYPRPTLGQLAENAPEELRSRILWYRDRLKHVIQHIAATTRGNNVLLRAGLKVVDRIFRELTWQEQLAIGYTETGRGSGELCAAAALLDQRG